MIFKKIVVDKEKITVRRIFNSKTVFWQQIKEFKFVLTGATINGRPENQWHVLFTTFEPLKYLNFAELSDVGRLIFSPIERSFASHPGVPEFLAIVDRYQDFIKQNTSNCYLLDSFTKLAPAHVLLQALVSYHPQSCLIENQPLDLRSNILMN
ncbi:MAG: hypothetical protein Q8P32_00420 [Candidatus Komeilibacteria bacterium]|nr:hypothetical protein [Candidatus Komeilibacteria bacterium]